MVEESRSYSRDIGTKVARWVHTPAPLELTVNYGGRVHFGLKRCPAHAW